MHGERDESRRTITSEPATPRDRRVSLAFNVAIVVASVVIWSTAHTPVARVDGFIPAIQAVIAVTDFITGVLLFAHYAIDRTRALLWLAVGYLFSAVLVVAQGLTFPGAFTPTGLFGVGLQAAAWLYIPWHAAVPIAAIGYVLARQRQGAAEASAAAPAVVIRRAVIATMAAALVVSWAIIAGEHLLPPLVVSEAAFSRSASAATVLPLVASVAAFLLLWRRRRSVLDEWLIVALTASVMEAALIVLVGASRYTVAFYTTRGFSLIVSSAVLVALLTDMTRTYVRRSIVVKALERERANRLMNLDVVISSIGHEIRQPLTVITTSCTVIYALLREPKIDVDAMRETVDDVTSASVRIGETIDSLRGLFRSPQEGQQRVDVNQIVLESLSTLATALSDRRIAVGRSLATDLPRVVGHGGQLREVFVNIVQNAIDAMAPVIDRSRTLEVRTSYEDHRISVTIEDSGLGIEQDRLPNLFTAAISTKAFGLGLGLSICQMIVDRHHGRLSVSSEVGKGTRFHVVLPAEPTVVPPDAQAHVAPAAIKAEA